MKRYFEENAAYFVTTITKDRNPVFSDEKLCRILLVTVEYYKTLLDYLVLGYCLMPDHFHIILRPGKRFNLSFVIKMIKGSFARKVNKLNETHGHLWQRRFYDELIRNESQFTNQLNYMHYNPVSAGLVQSASEYHHSSYAQYYGDSPANAILEIDRLE